LLEPFVPGLDVPGILRHLTHTNIISIDRAAKTVTLHPIDQDYAYSQLPEEGDFSRPALERRAADYYVQLRKPEEEWKTIDDLEPQLAEFEHRVRAIDYDEACRILIPIEEDYLYLWGFYAHLVKMREKLFGQLIGSDLQIDNLRGLGKAYHAIGQNNQAIILYNEGLAIAKKTNDRQRTGQLWGDLGRAYHRLGQIKEQAIKLYEDSLAIAREFGDYKGEQQNLDGLGRAYRAIGEVKRAIEFHEEALKIARENDDQAGEGQHLGRLAVAYRVLGQFKLALNFCQKALDTAREIGDRRGEGRHLGDIGSLIRRLGQFEQASDYHRQAIKITREIYDRRDEGMWLNSLGLEYMALGKYKEANESYIEALAIAQELKDQEREAHSLLGLGRVALAQHRLSDAEDYLGLPEDSGPSIVKGQTALILGIVHLYNLQATDVFDDAVKNCDDILEDEPNSYEVRYTRATAMVGQAVCNPKWSDETIRPDLLAPALTEYRRALEITAAPGVVQDAIRDLELIQAAGIEGLEPVFDLLEKALAKNDEQQPD
jgi:tetratricopeptide (TPR) repeat protein